MSTDDASAPAPADLIERARTRHVVVVGGGIAGLVAAWQCARVGMDVTVLEASSRSGGAIRRATVGGITLDVGAESYATRGGHVRRLIDELGLGADVVAPNGARAWLAGAPSGAAPLPPGGVLGIPGNPFAADVRRIIGWRGAWRAYLDRLRPPLTIGHTHSLGALVSQRMGTRVLDRLVEPVVQGVYSARAHDIDVDRAAPGLNAALTRTGSLSGAVSALSGDRATKAPGGAVEGVRGGITRIVDALVDRLHDVGATVSTDVRVTALQRGTDRWQVALGGPEGDGSGPEAPSPGGATTLPADAVIVATDERMARALLMPVIPGLGDGDGGGHAAAEIEVVTLVVDARVLDNEPRGSGVLTVPGSFVAKALTHSTAKWAWLAEEARIHAPDRHVVRVSFGSQGEPPATAHLSDADALALGLAEASALLGVDLPPATLVAGHRERYTQSQPASVIGRAAAMAGFRERVAATAGVAVVGAWISGTGLAQVVPDAATEGERIRAALLWTDPGPVNPDTEIGIQR